jgi:hypothetical protein
VVVRRRLADVVSECQNPHEWRFPKGGFSPTFERDVDTLAAARRETETETLHGVVAVLSNRRFDSPVYASSYTAAANRNQKICALYVAEVTHDRVLPLVQADEAAQRERGRGRAREGIVNEGWFSLDDVTSVITHPAEREVAAQCVAFVRSVLWQQ